MQVSQVIRDFTAMRAINDSAHSRSLFESVMAPEVIMALEDWIRAGARGVLIGGAALSYHVRPRYTQDLDFLFLQIAEVPEQVMGFKRTRSGAFQHNKTHVEVEVVTPEKINLPHSVANFVYQTASNSNGVLVASESGIVALKLFRLSRQDQADIIALIKTGRVALEGLALPETQQTAFEQLVRDAQTDPHSP